MKAKVVLHLLIGLALPAGEAVVSAARPQIPLQDSDPRLGAVASENRECSRIGIDLLRDGGNAADAIVGTVLCVGVLGMYHSGIGGGGFILIRDAKGKYEFIDARETAPAAAYEDMYKDAANDSVVGGLASGVPGDLRGLEYLHNKYGVLPWTEVVQPAIRLARDGFNVTKDIYRYMQYSKLQDDFLSNDPDWAIDFAPNGTQLGLGDWMTRRRYAATLDTIAEEGPGAFYSGAIADATIRAIQEHGGTMTLKDLRDYQIRLRKPLEIQYRDFRIIGCGAPASGAVVFSALNTVEEYDDMGDWDAYNISTHRLDESIRFAYGERGRLGDPHFVGDVYEYEAHMLDKIYAKTKRSKISDKHTLNVSDYNPDGYEIRDDHGTSHIVAADASGMAISLTTTLNLIFGSQVIVPETGVILNDQMNDFSIPGRKNEFGFRPSTSNYIRPGKRPMSAMTPVIVEHIANGSLYYAGGAAGGSRIPTATIQNLWHVLDHEMNVSASLAMPRFHDQLMPDVIGFEWSSDNHTLHDRPGFPGDDDEVPEGVPDESAIWPSGSESGIGTGFIHGFNNQTVAFMRARGHHVTWVPPGYSSAQALRVLYNGTFEAGGEPRQADSAGFAV